MSQSDSYQDEMEAELEGLRQELETMQSFAQSSTIPFPSDASYNQEQPSSGRPYRKPISRGIWLLIIGIVPFGVIALIGFMKSNDIKFSQDEPGNTPITLSELALHNTPKDSWVALHGKVYDLTSYAKRHPGGARLVTDLAGMDGTLDYDIFHPVSLLAAVEGDIIGPLVVEEQTGYGGNDDVSDDSEGTETDCENDPTCVTLEELKRHSTAHDCWVAMHGNVYDLTFYANFHPGGSRIVTKLAGTDGTSDYDIFHPIELLQTLRGVN
jgi:cytochrome b involved in lipid metabolism